MHPTSQLELCRKLQQTVRHLQILANSRSTESERLANLLQKKTGQAEVLQNQAQEASARVLELERQMDLAHREIEALRQEVEEVQRGQKDANREELQHIQEENLHLMEVIRSLEMQCSEAEEKAERRGLQVQEIQGQLMMLDEEASATRSSNTETQRLTDENALLANQLRQMELNLRDLIDTQGLGHTNSKQPIQYHLRLKNELEEMRSECVGLLKERFHLEQCIRYLAANASVPRYLDPDVSGSMRSVLHRTAVQPASLRKSHLYLTPSRRASMLKSGRGVAANSSGCSTPSKADLMASIHSAVSKTATSFQELAEDVEQAADSAAQPVRRRQSLSMGKGIEDDASVSSSGSAPSVDGERHSPQQHDAKPPKVEELLGEVDRAVERRIVARIVEICSPGKTGKTSRLMQNIQERHGSESGALNSGTPRSTHSQQGSKVGAVAISSGGGKALWRG